MNITFVIAKKCNDLREATRKFSPGEKRHSAIDLSSGLLLEGSITITYQTFSGTASVSGTEEMG